MLVTVGSAPLKYVLTYGVGEERLLCDLPGPPAL